MSRRARLTVAYVGTDLHGFAEADGVGTVMGELRGAIERIVRQPVAPVGAGRTDAGVHGWGQVVSLDLPDDTDLADLQRRVNKLCAPAIAVRDAAWTADPEFNARFSAQWRHYRYHVLAAPVPDPFLAGTAWHVPQPLNLWAMQLACDPLIGEHDFASFCRRPKVAEGATPPSLRRRVISADWRAVPDDHPGLLRFEIRANAFCHQMVRSIVGTLVDVGQGKLHAGDVRGIMLQRDRRAAGTVAPPHGLVLWEVGYPPEEGDARPANGGSAPISGS
ncbi:MAG: tRNA pseudouridine synthase [Actinomycetota bacterium]|jgi:tRNA pseudouridine38-40 synthase